MTYYPTIQQTQRVELAAEMIAAGFLPDTLYSENSHKVLVLGLFKYQLAIELRLLVPCGWEYEFVNR